MKITDGETTHEISDSLVAGILEAAWERWGVPAASPLIATIEPLVELVIEETARALFGEGFCSFDWHRRVYEPVYGGADLCQFCELTEAEHERLPICPRQSEETEQQQ